MESSLGEDCFTGQQRLGDAFGNCERPIVKLVFAVCERDQEAGIGNADHDRLNPLRWDRSFGPSTVPARDINARAGVPLRAFSR
jgi:hypothetical protein